MDKSKTIVINILKFLKPYWRKLFCAMMFSAMEVSALLLMPIFLKNFIDSGLEQKNLNSAYESLIGYFLIVMILVLSGFIKSRLLKRSSECSIKDAQLNLFSRITDSTFKTSDSFTNGSLMSYIQNDSRDMLDKFSTTGISILQNIIRIIIGIVVLGSMNMKILFMLILFLPLYMLDVFALNKPIQESSSNLQEQKARVTEFLQESLSAKAEILLLNRREWNLKRLNNTLKRNVHLSLVNDLWINVSSNLGFLIYWLAHILVYLVGAKYVINSSISIGELILAAQYMDNIYMPCKLLINDNAALQKSIVSGRRYFSLNKKLRENSYFSTSAKEHLSFSRSIEFKNVSFNYGSEDVLTNINFKITKGESVAIMGSSGSGKSTLLKLLLNLYSPTSGEILVDSVNLDSISKESLYNDMGVVFQDVFLFNSSIKANILLSNLNASEAALSKACLNSSSQEFIELFSDGYETDVGERFTFVWRAKAAYFYC